MDLATRIRARLAEGQTADDVVAQLMADGMSESNARRIVTGVQSSPPPDASFPNAADETIDDDDEECAKDPTGHAAMISGLCFISLGFGFLLVSALAEKPDPKFRITYGAILVGVAAMYRGLRRWDPQRSPFPAWGLLAALLLPAGSLYGMYAYLRQPTAAERLADEQREEQRRAEEKTARQKAELERIATGRLQAMKNFTSGDPVVRCSAATFFADQKMPDASGGIKRLLNEDSNIQVKRCALEALLAAGQKRDAVEVLEKLADNAAYKPITLYGFSRMFEDPDPEVRARAIAAVKRASTPR